MPTDPKTSKQHFDVAVIGAGIAGTFTAIQLAKQLGLKVALIEKESKILPASSTTMNQCYKLHTGVHYIMSNSLFSSDEITEI